jgi:hypothetical protein
MIAALLQFGGIALALFGGGMLLPSPATVVDEKPTRLALVLVVIGAALIVIGKILQ